MRDRQTQGPRRTHGACLVADRRIDLGLGMGPRLRGADSLAAVDLWGTDCERQRRRRIPWLDTPIGGGRRAQAIRRRWAALLAVASAALSGLRRRGRDADRLVGAVP